MYLLVSEGVGTVVDSVGAPYGLVVHARPLRFHGGHSL